LLKCSCGELVGYTYAGEHAIFDESVVELQGCFKLEAIQAAVRNHGIEDRTKDILFVQVGPSLEAIKVKVLSQVVIYTL
jgi:hypothetical protein